MQKIWNLCILDVADKLEIRYSNRGAFRKCRCFMHEDKHPSMWFKLSNNTWSCPVCSKGGGLVSLVREHEKLSYAEALEWLVKAFDIYVYDDNERYRPLKSGQNHSKTSKQTSSMTQNTISTKESCNEADNTLPFDLVTRSFSYETTFCKSLVSTGILSEEQMQQAARLYHLGATHDGGVIFWNIDETQQLREGKIMWYKDDCHRDHKHVPSTISSRLIKRGLILRSWTARKCFFGQHLLRNDDVSGYTNKIIAIVESEKTAVICSQLLPDYTWLSCGGLSQLIPEMFVPLSRFLSSLPMGKDGKRGIVVFPDTDLKGDAHRQWTERCKEASKLTNQPIYVSPLLERHASEDQKRRKIDIADFIIENKA